MLHSLHHVVLLTLVQAGFWRWQGWRHSQTWRQPQAHLRPHLLHLKTLPLPRLMLLPQCQSVLLIFCSAQHQDVESCWCRVT